MIITAKKLICGKDTTVLTNGGLLIEGEKITAVGRAEDLRQNFPHQENIDYGDATILPGLIDMHIHLGIYEHEPDKALFTPHLVAYLALNNAERQLAKGVTTLRDAYSPDAVCRQLALAAKKGWVRVPRIIHCNQALTISGGIDWQYDGTVQVDGPEEIRKAVRRQFLAGALWIKVMGHNRIPGVCDFDQEELNTVVGESHRRGFKAMAHATIQPALQMCIDAGFDTIEHGSHLTIAQGRQMKEKGVAWVPTIYIHKAIYENLRAKIGSENDLSDLTERERQTLELYSQALASYKNNLKPLYDTGAIMLAGTDCVMDGMEDITVAWELACMVEFGLTPLEAIGTATVNAARVLGLDGAIGELSVGAYGDILVVKGDATQDIHALKQVKDVYQAGKRIHCTP